MKFGKRLAVQAHPDWAEKYLDYKSLKELLKISISQQDYEGSAWFSLLQKELGKVNQFFLLEEKKICEQFNSLNELEDNDFRQRKETFLQFLQILQLLRYFVVLNYIAVHKIVKKRNKMLRATCLPLDYLSILFEQPFYISTKLAKITVRTEILAMKMHPEEAIHKEDFCCPICLSLLCDPVVLSCTHRFCWLCLSRSSERIQSCPICRKDQHLDPQNFKVDWILKEFLEGKFPQSKKKSFPTTERHHLHQELESRANRLPDVNQSNSPESPQPPKKCDYKILKSVGSGMFGQVFLASDPLGNLVALKRLAKDHPQFRLKSVHQEIVAGQMLKHSNIVSFRESFETASSVYLVLEYFESRDLHSILSSREFKGVPEGSTKKMFRQIVAAVEHCHHNHICHRDIKLENLLLDCNGTVKLIDFGLCAVLPSVSHWSERSCHHFVGSMGFVAPEVQRRISYSGFAADIWSLGIVLYSLLHGRFPYTTHQFYKIAAGHPWELCFGPKISDECRNLLQKMLSVDPKERLTIDQVAQHSWLTDCG